LSIEARAAELYHLIRQVGFRSLMMGDHAVRYYGLERRTVDYDLQVAIDPKDWATLQHRLLESGRLASVDEGHSWRPRDFRRYVIGVLPDGREERLEFWRTNHLLAPFEEAWTRREEGTYGGRSVAFLGLEDLIRSKETERDDDWADVRILEEIADERRAADSHTRDGRVRMLGALRSRRGFELAQQRGFLEDPIVIAEALRLATCPITHAYLAPYPGGGPDSEVTDVLQRALGTVTPGSAKHLALVEAARNRYQLAAAAADRAEKERLAKPAPGAS
jgi:hypothetical protein